MNFYFAPMEGLTRYIYRNAHHRFFNRIDKYFAPFVSAHESGKLQKRERDDLSPENNRGMVLVPQILANRSSEFITFANIIKAMGYEEINLNLGCPSGTVVAKYKGAGFLARPEELDSFLYEIFSWGGTGISIKTRIGMEQPEEFYALLEIFNKYPLKELIVHPRVRKDFYKNPPNRDIFRYALQHSKNPVCYNGNLFTADQYREFEKEFPNVKSVMLGRGMLVNPGLVAEIRENARISRETLKEFHDTVYGGYKDLLSGDGNVLYKMKEFWFYLICLFPDHEKWAKKIRKSTRLPDYENIVAGLFREQILLDDYRQNLGKI